MKSLVQRVDVVWNMYITGSLKETTLGKRGKVIHRHDKPDTNRAAFLKANENRSAIPLPC